MITKRDLSTVIILSFFPVFYLTLSLISPFPAHGIEIVNRDMLSCELSGNLKGFYLSIHDNPFGKSYDSGLMLLRLILGGTVSDKASFEFHLLEGGTVNPLDASPSGFVSFSEAERFRAHRWDHVQTTHEDFSSRIAIDRANITLHIPYCDLIVGRQAISLGTTFFWNPNDLLTAFSPYEFDRDYKPGVDAVNAEIALGEFSGINLLYGAGKRFKWDESALLIRGFTNIRDFDVAVMAGRFREDGFLGADFSGEVGPGIGVRGELSYFAAEKDSDFMQLVMGTEYRFENNLYLAAEYFYNGFGTPHRSRYLERIVSDRITEGDIYNISRHYLGILGSYEVTPLLIV